jgi:mannose-6-phosphate isomerase-like protein (cupin superfamily)
MTASRDSRVYETIHDPADLRIAVRELYRVRAWLDQFADVAAELPELDLEHVAASRRMTTAVVSLLLAQAEARLHKLATKTRPPEVVVVDAARQRSADQRTGFALVPMVSEPLVPTEGVSSAVLRMEVGQTSRPHLYPDADAVLIVVFGAAEIVWRDAAGEARPTVVRRHQHAYIRRGTRHTLANTGPLPLLAVQVRGTADVRAGLELVAELAEGSPAGAAVGGC